MIAVEARPEGLYLPTLDLFLDPRGAVPRAFVSHAHADHLGDAPPLHVVASPETLALVRARSTPERALRSAEALAWDGAIELPVEGGGHARLSIAPAGHVLGAAQLVVDHPKGRFVYTGDYRTGAGRTHAAGAPVPCDELAIESTFALPIFRFPDRDATLASLVAWCRAELDAAHTPVLLAYALGKSQELVHALLDAELPVAAHGAVYRVCEAYEALGVPLGVGDGRLRTYVDVRNRGVDEPAVVIVPPRAHALAKKLKRAHVAYVSGWAHLDAPIEQRRADAGFAFSDHADHDDLMTTIRKTGAARVYATHGDTEALALLLTNEGIDATALVSPPLDGADADGGGT